MTDKNTRNKIVSMLLCFAMMLSTMATMSFTTSAIGNEASDYPEELQTLTKQYVMYATGENALQIHTSKTMLEGNLYIGGNLDAYSGRVDIYGRADLVGHVNKHEHTIFNRLQYVGGLPYETSVISEETGETEAVIEYTAGRTPYEYPHFGQAVMNSLGDNYAHYQWWHGVHNPEVSNDSPIYVQNGGLQFTASTVTVQDTIIADNSIHISASTALNTAEGEEVNLYVPNGNIGIYVGDADINGIIYAPNGTVQICGSNININGVIIAKEILISAENFTINENYDLSLAEHLLTGVVEIPLSQDSDRDLLQDYFEVFEFKTDPFEFDTDNDGLGDGLEAIGLGYNPLVKDTDNNGIEDGKEDFDGDGLINIDEVNYGTDLTLIDTDKDELTDGDEVHIYGTDPTSLDTDDDGLWDGEEGDYGTIYAKYGKCFNQLDPDTDDNGILDGDEPFSQLTEKTVTSHDGAVIGVSVQMTTNGSLERNLSIDSMMEIDMMSSGVVGLVGDPFDFTTPTTFDSATLTFTLNQSKLGDTQFNDLIIMWYDEENQKFVECNDDNGYGFSQNIGNSTITITTNHFSQYMIVDSKKWYKAWEDSLLNIVASGDDGSTISPDDVRFNTVFVIDTSGSMRDSLPEERGWTGYDIVETVNGRKSCHRITAAEGFIDEMKQGDKASIVTFADSAFVRIGLTDYKTDLKTALQQINDNGATRFSNALNTAIEVFGDDFTDDDTVTVNRIFFLSDGVHEDAGDTDAAVYAAVNSANLKGIRIYTFGLGNESGDVMLKEIAKRTGGEFHKVIEANELTWSIGNVSLPKSNHGYLKDTDGDGIPDIIELYGLCPNGDPIGTDPNKIDSDDDGLHDDEEVLFGMGAYRAFIRNANNMVDNAWDILSGLFTFKSNPADDDWDEDKLKDYEDPKPSDAYNNGDLIDLTPEKLELLQFSLNYLGYSDISFSDMGKIYGPVTRTAVYVYQMNHGFQTTNEQNGRMRGFSQIDDLTFATIINDFANEYVNDIGDINGSSSDIYDLIVEDISKKPYFSKIKKIAPTLLPEQEELGIELIQKPNDFIKSNSGKSTDLYFYDYTNPLNRVMYKNMALAEYEAYMMTDTWEATLQTYYIFYEYVKSGGDWDYKLPSSWEKEFDNIPFMTIHFPFILRGDFCTPELYGNIHYGFVGAALGFSENVLIFGSKFSAYIQDNFFGESDDWQYVKKGIKYFNDDISV